MNSPWDSRQAYPSYPEVSNNYCKSYFEKQTDPESYQRNAIDERKFKDPCLPERSFEWPLEEECDYEEDSCLQDEDCYAFEEDGAQLELGDSDGEDPLYTSQTSEEEFLACGDSSVYNPDSPAGFVPECVDHRRQINDAIRRINAFTTLDEFMAEVGPLTEDRGIVMRELMTAEMATFREFVKDIYKTRIQHKEELTEEEFLRLQEKYNKKIVDLNNKISSGVRAIERVIPDFNHDDYKRHGYAYVHDKIEDTEVNVENTKEAENKRFAHEQAGRNIRSAEHKAKWFLKEARRLERKNDKATYLLNKMYEQLASISDKVALGNNRLHTYNVQLQKYACCLKSQMCRNQELLDHLTRVGGGKVGATKCFTINPEDVVKDCSTSYVCP